MDIPRIRDPEVIFISVAVFVSVVFATFFNNALHWYTQFQTYPLFAWVGKDHFHGFHKEYERRLPTAIYIPYTLLMASNVLLVFLGPPEISSWWAVVLLVLNASIMVESLVAAVPVHRRLDREAPRHATEDLERLVSLNALRLAASTASSGVVLYLLVRMLIT